MSSEANFLGGVVTCLRLISVHVPDCSAPCRVIPSCWIFDFAGAAIRVLQRRQAKAIWACCLKPSQAASVPASLRLGSEEIARARLDRRFPFEDPGRRYLRSRVRPLSYVRFRKFRSRVWANLELVGGPQRSQTRFIFLFEVETLEA